MDGDARHMSPTEAAEADLREKEYQEAAAVREANHHQFAAEAKVFQNALQEAGFGHDGITAMMGAYALGSCMPRMDMTVVNNAIGELAKSIRETDERMAAFVDARRDPGSAE